MHPIDPSTKPIWPARWWWAILGILLLLAGALRYTGYNFSLPYVDHVDEPAYNIAGRMIIDFGSAKPLGMQGYPPGIVTLNYVLLKLFQDPSTPPSTILGPLRLISITFSFLTILVIALLGYRLATPLTGLIAAGLWTINPLIVEHSRYATADNFVTFFTLAAFFLSLTGTLYDRDKWTTYGIVSIMLAIVFKYQAVFVLPLIGALPLLRLLYFRHDRASMIRVLKTTGNHAIILGFFFFWLIMLYPSFEATSAPDWSASDEKQGIPTQAILKLNFHRAFDPLWSERLRQLALLGLLGLAWPIFRKRVHWLSFAAIFMGLVLWGLGVSFYGFQSFRQFVAAAAMSVILGSVGLAAWAEVLAYGLGRLRLPAVIQTRRLWISASLMAALLVYMNWANIQDSIANAEEHTLPDHRNDLATYMDTSLTPGPYIATSENHKTFNRSWGGYAGLNEFPLVEVIKDFREPLIESWRAEGAVYVILPYYAYDVYRALPNAEDYFDQMLLLKSYPPSDDYRGPDMVVFRLYPIQHEINGGSLGPVQLIGYDIDHAEVTPGGTITFTMYWQASEALSTEYAVYNHLTPLDLRDIVSQIDGPPLLDVRRPTQTWDDPNEVLISRSFTLTIGEDVAPGEYRLITGFYRRDTWERLQTPDGNDYLEVTTIRVVAP